MKNITDTISEGYGNNSRFGTVSMNGVFIDYFEDKLAIGDEVAFIDNSYRDSRDFCRAIVSSLTTSKSGEDFAILKDVEYPNFNSKTISKKRCDLLIKINK